MKCLKCWMTAEVLHPDGIQSVGRVMMLSRCALPSLVLLARGWPHALAQIVVKGGERRGCAIHSGWVRQQASPVRHQPKGPLPPHEHPRHRPLLPCRSPGRTAFRTWQMDRRQHRLCQFMRWSLPNGYGGSSAFWDLVSHLRSHLLSRSASSESRWAVPQLLVPSCCRNLPDQSAAC